MNRDLLTTSAALLDDLASRTLSQPDFYRALEDAGQYATALCGFLLVGISSLNSYDCGRITDAAECLKTICIESNNLKWEAAMDDARRHSSILYRISETMK